MGQWVASDHNNVSEYQVSGWPYFKTFVIPSGVVFKLDFPTVTKFVKFTNLTTPATQLANALRVGNSLSDVNFGSWPPAVPVDCAIVPAGMSTPDLPLKCKTLYLKSNDGNAVTISMFVGCTNVPRKNFPTLEERQEEIVIQQFSV